jgi:hypothetical protein
MFEIKNINSIYITTSLLCITALTYIFYNNNYSAEDEYQKSIFEEGAKQHIYSTTYVNNKNNYDNTLYRLNRVVIKSITNNFRYNTKICDKILQNYKIEKENKEQIMMNNEELWTDISKNNPSEFNVIFNNEKKRLTFVIDHQYFGGLYFLKLFGNIINCVPITIYKEKYVPIMSELSIIKFFYFWITKKNNKRLEMKNEIDRIGFIFNYNKIDEKVRRQTLIFYNLLKNIYNGIERKDKDFLRVLITVGYETDRKTLNNVGGVFIDFYRDMKIEELEKILMKNKYQAHATNLLQKYINKGKYVRNDIDIVLTSGYLLSETNEDMSYIQSSYTTYLSVAHYPIYIVSFTIGDKAYVTITNMSKDVDIKKIKEHMNEHMVDIKLSIF